MNTQDWSPLGWTVWISLQSYLELNSYLLPETIPWNWYNCYSMLQMSVGLEVKWLAPITKMGEGGWTPGTPGSRSQASGHCTFLHVVQLWRYSRFTDTSKSLSDQNLLVIRKHEFRSGLCFLIQAWTTIPQHGILFLCAKSGVFVR